MTTHEHTHAHTHQIVFIWHFGSNEGQKKCKFLAQTHKHNNDWIVWHLDKCTELHSDDDFYLIFYYKVVTAHNNKQTHKSCNKHRHTVNYKILDVKSWNASLWAFFFLFCSYTRSYLPFSFWRMTVQCPVVNPQNHRQHGIINKTVAVATRVLCRSFDFFRFSWLHTKCHFCYTHIAPRCNVIFSSSILFCFWWFYKLSRSFFSPVKDILQGWETKKTLATIICSVLCFITTITKMCIIFCHGATWTLNIVFSMVCLMPLIVPHGKK